MPLRGLLRQTHSPQDPAQKHKAWWQKHTFIHHKAASWGAGHWDSLQDRTWWNHFALFWLSTKASRQHWVFWWWWFCFVLGRWHLYPPTSGHHLCAHPCHTPAYLRPPEKDFHTHLVPKFFHLVSGLCSCFWGTPRERLTPVATGACLPGSLQTVPTRENRLAASGHSLNRMLKQRSLSVKEACWLPPRASAWGPGFRFETHLEATYPWKLKMEDDFAK